MSRRVIVVTGTSSGSINVWVNNLGRGIPRQPSELTDDDIDEMIRGNVKSALYGMQEVLRVFRARGSPFHVIGEGARAPTGRCALARAR